MHLVSVERVKVGGQAVIEGVMMRAPQAMAIAVRKPNGEITIKADVWHSLAEKFAFLKWPVLRGVLVLGEALVNGIQALSFSANEAMEEVKEEKTGSWAIFLTMVVALALGIGLFVILPHLISLAISRLAPDYLGIKSMAFHLIDGLIKIVFFIVYILCISQMKDIKRIFQYHGAEHKSIYAYEAGEELTVENARKYSTLHPRCGTSFVLMVLLISILFFSVFFGILPRSDSWSPVVANIYFIVMKVGLMLPIAGCAYEFTRWAGNQTGNAVVSSLIAPGLHLQKLTTREPSDDQIEVALAALAKTLFIQEQFETNS